MPCILLVEDEENLHASLRLNLTLEGYEVESAYNGEEAIEKLAKEYFDLVILDLMLPQIDGLSVLETMRLKKIQSPVLILSAKGTTEDRILGLRSGADDYLSKPFALEELLLRVEKIIQKSLPQSVGVQSELLYQFGGHLINFKSLEARLSDGRTVELSKKEAMLLQLFVKHADEVITREMILQQVWGYNVFPTTRTIDNFLLNLRKYFEQDTRNPKYFHSVRGLGYKFTP